MADSRSGSQTGPAPQTPASPPQTGKPVVEHTQPGRRRTSGRMALAFSVAGVFCCGVPALIGMFMGRSELLAIKDGNANPDGKEAARAAFYVGLGATLLYAAIVTIWVLMILAFRDI